MEGVYHQTSGTLTSWELHHKKIKVHKYQGEGSLSCCSIAVIPAHPVDKAKHHISWPNENLIGLSSSFSEQVREG